jgi:hypothetical protein
VKQITFKPRTFGWLCVGCFVGASIGVGVSAYYGIQGKGAGLFPCLGLMMGYFVVTRGLRVPKEGDGERS